MPKNKTEKPAAALARQRWSKTTAAQRSQTARDLNAARWGKKKKAKRAGTS
jgi:hypothetical protein